ncbi:protein RIK-like [Olea europaea var. sylvestris]|uniref:protein RIK-like n=1 Tax=Olea europaea var. sylvestris TaxID=158386 RepID=UPI000C1D5A9B|nr:protein RIK-like [Olea europaea var. sylvestris]
MTRLLYIIESSDLTLSIRGQTCCRKENVPLDHYINHIMSETGTTVLLRGHGSGNSENALDEGTMWLLAISCYWIYINMFISYPKLFLTPQDDLWPLASLYLQVFFIPKSGNESILKERGASSLTSSVDATDDASHGAELKSMWLSNRGMPQASIVCHPCTSLIGGTSFIGYEGIYPQAKPLQQVALALRQSTSPVTAAVGPTTSANAKLTKKVGPSEEKCPPRRRKFQELSIASKGPANSHQNKLQGSEFQMPRELTSHVGAKDVPIMPAPRKLIRPSPDVISPPPSKSMPPPPPPKSMPPPPPLKSLLPPPLPPKLSSTPKVHETNSKLHNSKPEPSPDTLIKLMEYGDDDDDDLEENIEKPFKSLSSAPKPFWVV